MPSSLKILSLCAALISMPALAQTDPHAGHHPPVVPPATALTADRTKTDPDCPMMRVQGTSGGTMPSTPPQGGSEKMHGGRMMMDKCMEGGHRPAKGTATPPTPPSE
ncbi:hypothetical protein sphantq_00556 [Sphingobium sp. AntQ-1]|uniref:hypothetical protein n=1 Tax=Sphingobium sp. AntQ-1 TaxID=2930091 RepID=UPI00234FB4C8|nr:hypothetical protein [Sphingobium sp. AntQ-1]WCP12159.1 hypothetical protein sphantq_00556 [Sphingobium sp. AntQ-1]